MLKLSAESTKVAADSKATLCWYFQHSALLSALYIAQPLIYPDNTLVPIFLWYLCVNISMIFWCQYFYDISVPIFLWYLGGNISMLLALLTVSDTFLSYIGGHISMLAVPRYLYDISVPIFLWYLGTNISMLTVS